VIKNHIKTANLNAVLKAFATKLYIIDSNVYCT